MQTSVSEYAKTSEWWEKGLSVQCIAFYNLKNLDDLFVY